MSTFGKVNAGDHKSLEHMLFPEISTGAMKLQSEAILNEKCGVYILTWLLTLLNMTAIDC
jgi:hypothetical protein